MYNFSNLPRMAYRFLLAIAASSYVVVIFLIKEGVTLCGLPDLWCYTLYSLTPIVVTWLCLLIAKKLPRVGVEAKVIRVEPANCEFLPSFLGYFFVALSVPNFTTLWFVYGIIALLTWLSQNLYFNPLMLILGYKFYFITTDDEARVFVITRKKLKRPREVCFDSLYCINEFTYVDI